LTGLTIQVGSKDYLIAMNKEEFFHFRRLLMSLDHKLTDMTYHSSSSEQQEEVSSFRMMETTTTYPQNSNNGMEDHSPFMQRKYILCQQHKMTLKCGHSNSFDGFGVGYFTYTGVWTSKLVFFACVFKEKTPCGMVSSSRDHFPSIFVVD